ncbi:hypothetical protein Q9233_007248 [Columba guinea]|nr:hypothetical protein Q9233_007248 [Columba guinea]
MGQGEGGTGQAGDGKKQAGGGTGQVEGDTEQAHAGTGQVESDTEQAGGAFAGRSDAPSGSLGHFREHSANTASARAPPAGRGGAGARRGPSRQDRPVSAMASPSRRLQTKPVITCLKSVLLTYTFVFWVSGIVLLAVGVWGRVSLAVYFSLLDEKATNVPFVLVGAGTVVVLLGTFGCFATCRGSTWMLKLYAMLLSLIFLIVLVAAVVGFVFRHEVSLGDHCCLQMLQSKFSAGFNPSRCCWRHRGDAGSGA